MRRRDWNALAFRVVALAAAFLSLSSLKYDFFFIRKEDTLFLPLVKSAVSALFGLAFPSALWLQADRIADRLERLVPVAAPSAGDQEGPQNFALAITGLIFAILAAYNLFEVVIFGLSEPLSGWEIPRAGVDVAMICLGLLVSLKAPTINQAMAKYWSRGSKNGAPENGA